jgi:ATP-dependent 26S proteasome regulatory subunit
LNKIVCYGNCRKISTLVDYYLSTTISIFHSYIFVDIGGLDKQIQELIEAVVLPMTQSEKFEAIG